MGGWIFGADPFASSMRCWVCGVRSHEVQGIWETHRRPQREPEPLGARSMTPPLDFVTEDPWEYIDLCPTCKLLPEPEMVAAARRLARQRLGLPAEDDEDAAQEHAEQRREA